MKKHELDKWTCGRCLTRYYPERPWHCKDGEAYRCEVPGCGIRYGCGVSKSHGDKVAMWLE
jgi:hypothetical protein